METRLGYPKYPKFSLDEPRYPQSEFLGRFLQNLDVIDPVTLLTSDSQLADAVKLLDDFKKGQLDPKVTDEDLWEARKIKQAILHPDTGEKIFMPFRMSGYVPFGVPMVVGILLPNPSWAQIVFFQWINQSHNACVNYANRNASRPTELDKFLKGYAAACTAAVGISVGLTALIKRAEALPPTTKALITRFVPTPAVCTASTLNALMMRWHEREAGIEVLDSKGSVVGVSQVAARRAVRDTAITRFCLPAPIIFLPAAAMARLERTAFLKRHPRLHIPINAAICTVVFGLSLPTSVSLFPQNQSITRADLEPEIQAKTKEDILYYNKGL